MNKKLLLEAGWPEDASNDILKESWDRLVKFFGSAQKVAEVLQNDVDELKKNKKNTPLQIKFHGV